jgi:hypothetical protein
MVNSLIVGIVCVFGVVGCSSLGEIAVGTIGGAFGNMLDRRIEDKLGNDAALSDEKNDEKLNKEE